MHLYCNRVRIGRSRSSKVVDFGTNRNGVCDFLLVINGSLTLVLCCTVSEIRRLISWKLRIFPTPSHLTPSLGANHFEFLDEFFIPKTRVLGLSVGEDFMILACVVFTQCQRVSDGQTVGRTDGQTSRLWLVHGLQVSTPRHNPSQPGQYSIYLPWRGGRLSWPR